MYAMSRSRPGVHHLNYREIETLSPLEEKAGVGIDTRFSEGTERALADDLFAKMSTGKVCDSLTVVNWKHSRMSVMGKALGCGPEEGCPKNYEKDEFDIIWQIEYAYESKIDVGSLGGSEDRDDAIVALYCIYGVSMFSLIYGGLGDLFIPVFVYMTVLLLMGITTLLSQKANKWLIIGGVSFILSDSLIGLDKFYQPIPFESLFIMSTYYLAQFSLVKGLFVTNKTLKEK